MLPRALLSLFTACGFVLFSPLSSTAADPAALASSALPTAPDSPDSPAPEAAKVKPAKAPPEPPTPPPVIPAEALLEGQVRVEILEHPPVEAPAPGDKKAADDKTIASWSNLPALKTDEYREP